MQTMINKIMYVVLLVMGTTTLFGQRDLTLYNMSNLSQSMSVNPAFRPKANVFINLPSASVGFTNSGFGAADLFTPAQTSFITDDSFFKTMKSLNTLQFQGKIDVFGFGFRVKKNYFTFGVSNSFSVGFDYTPDFLQLLLQGNGGSLAGKRANFDGLGINAYDYTTVAFGYNREINDKLVVGGTVKVLSGVANITTSNSTLGFSTGVNGTSIGFDGSAFIRSSNLGMVLDTTKKTSFPIASLYNCSNLGLALDLGATYKFSEKINLSASIIDLGYISWKDDVRNYELKKFAYTFNGVDASKILTDTANVMRKVTDTLSNSFKTEQSNTTYKTSLATRFYIGGTYNFNKYFNAGILWYSQIVKNQYHPALVISTSVNVKSWLTASVNYGMYANSYSNVGFGLSLRGGPLQFYVMSDNILAPFNLGGTRTASVRLGLNLVFGKGKDRVKKGTVEGKTDETKPAESKTESKSTDTPSAPATPMTPAPTEPAK
jgi:hypothetical protein